MKQTVKEGKRSSLHFPNNFRFITEKPLWVGVLLALALALIACLCILLGVRGVDWIRLQEKRAKLEANMTLWEEITKKYPTYRDAYFEEALLAYQLGQRQKAWNLSRHVLLIDPNFTQARELQSLLEKGK